MIISLILGRYTSKLAGLASWLRVLSSIVLKASGTFPKSAVSTPIAVNARHAILNSDPNRTYTSDTCASVAVPRDHAVKVSSSCFVAISRCVTDFSIVESYKIISKIVVKNTDTLYLTLT